MEKVNPLIIKMLNEKTGRDVTTAAGATFLQKDIESSLSEHLAVNTVKRFVGLIPYEYNHHQLVLNTIAKYLGFSSWEMLNDFVNDKISEFGNNNDNIINLIDLPIDIKLELKWEPDRVIQIKHIDKAIYEVISSTNSKLKKGDLLKLSQIVLGFPFIVSEVRRNGLSLGNYTAAAERGISGIRRV